MQNLLGIGITRPFSAPNDGPGTGHVMLQRPLQRVLAFRNRSIDDVVNDPIVKNEIYGFYKLHKQIHRSAEVFELERQWNR